MARATELKNPDGSHGGYCVFCPACKCGHMFDSRWEFNGDMDRPTFRPSMLVHEHKFGNRIRPACHSFITNGFITFLDDCGHELAGQQVELPDWDEMEKQPCIPCEECAKEPCCEDHKENPNVVGCIDGVRL